MPQLQISYVKTLNDKQSLRNIRLLAVEGLKEISPFVSRIDNLITELHNGVKKNEDTSVQYVCINDNIHMCILCNSACYLATYDYICMLSQ